MPRSVNGVAALLVVPGAEKPITTSGIRLHLIAKIPVRSLRVAAVVDVARAAAVAVRVAAADCV